MMVLVLFDNIKLFRDIAQAKSISRGASHNGISQSAASQHIQELEKKLGISAARPHHSAVDADSGGQSSISTFAATCCGARRSFRRRSTN